MCGDERRTYALDNAPLTRVRYRVDDRVRSEDGVEIVVAEHSEVDGCLVYRGFDAHGRPAEPIATADPYSAGVEGFDHSGIAPADPHEPDTTGASIAAYGN